MGQGAGALPFDRQRRRPSGRPASAIMCSVLRKCAQPAALSGKRASSSWTVPSVGSEDLQPRTPMLLGAST